MTPEEYQYQVMMDERNRFNQGQQAPAPVGPRAQGIVGAIGGLLGGLGRAVGPGLQQASRAIYGDDEMTRLRRQNAFQAMTLNPNQALIAANQRQMEYLQGQERAVEQANATAEVLRRAGREDLAKAIEANPQFAGVIYQEYLRSESREPTETFGILSPEQAKMLGLPEGSTYQMSTTTGKVSTVGGGGPSVNIDMSEQGIKTGTIPPGYYLDTSGAEPVLRVIPGGPVETQETERQQQQEERQQLAGTAGNVVLDDIRRYRDLVSNQGFFTPITGVTGAIARQFPSTPAADAVALSTTIRANIGFDRIQQMREASPTGGALGNVSDTEVETLQAVLGSLAETQSDEQLLYNLNRLEQIYTGILTKLQAYPNASEFGFTASQSSQSDPLGIL